jgi:hypothetical protein
MPTRAWSGTKEFNRLSGELAVSERRDFERRVLPFLHVLWPEALGTPALRSFDRLGADHLVWADAEPFPLVVQCKGFEAREHEIGPPQIEQCVRSLRAFRDAGLRATRYLLVHNRDGRNPELRTAVETELRQLVASGQVAAAELWDRQTLLRRAFDAMLERILAGIRERRLSPLPLDASGAGAGGVPPIETVPLATTMLVADQFRLHRTSPPEPVVADPATLVLGQAGTNLTVLLGEFGFGKTTAVARAAATGTRHVLLVAGAAISASTAGAKDFLYQCIDPERLMEGLPDEDQRELRLLIRPTLQYLLADPDLPVVVIVDGLDESAFLARSGGMQVLFNILQPVRVPVLLSMRTEFWHDRVAEFATVFGQTGPPDARRNRTIRLVELLPWTPAEIRPLLERERDARHDAAESARLGELLSALDSGEFEHLYGDIPRRPLFLRFIADSVARWGLPRHRVGKAGLFRDGAYLKTLRDATAPRRAGGAGRAPVLADGESAATAFAAAWEAMLHAAAAMTEVRDGALELLPSCTWDELRDATPGLARIAEPSGLFLHSLLAPAAAHEGPGNRRVRFAHRAFQEFFLAWFLLEHPERLGGAAPPPPVRDWMDAIDREGLRQSETA